MQIVLKWLLAIHSLFRTAFTVDTYVCCCPLQHFPNRTVGVAFKLRPFTSADVARPPQSLLHQQSQNLLDMVVANQVSILDFIWELHSWDSPEVKYGIFLLTAAPTKSDNHTTAPYGLEPSGSCTSLRVTSHVMFFVEGDRRWFVLNWHSGQNWKLPWR